MSKFIEHGLESIIFRSRWLLAPFYLGLIVSIGLLLVIFAKELWHLSTHIFDMPEQKIVVGILTLVDLSLVGSLLLMIIFSGYEIFISKIHITDHEDRPDWMGKVDFSGLKLKVIGAIVAISAIELLKTFVDISSSAGGDGFSESEQSVVMWKVIVHMAFVLSGVLFAIMDKIAAGTKHE